MHQHPDTPARLRPAAEDSIEAARDRAAAAARAWGLTLEPLTQEKSCLTATGTSRTGQHITLRAHLETGESATEEAAPEKAILRRREGVVLLEAQDEESSRPQRAGWLRGRRATR